jgi:hypothetical protein
LALFGDQDLDLVEGRTGIADKQDSQGLTHGIRLRGQGLCIRQEN